MIRELAVVLMLASAVGCCGVPTEDEIILADYGKPPTLELARAHIDVVLKNSLKDPNSVQVELLDEQPKKAWYCTSGFGSHVFCWTMRVNVNAKNSFGGYNGFKVWTFFWHEQDGAVNCIRWNAPHD